MKRVIIGASLLFALAHGRPLNIDYVADEVVETATLDKTKDTVEGELVVDGRKGLTVETPTDFFREGGRENFDGAFLVEKTGDKAKGIDYTYGKRGRKRGTAFDENVQYRAGGRFEKSEFMLADKEEGDYDAFTGLLKGGRLIVFDGGDEEVLNTRGSGEYFSFSEHAVNPEFLNSFSGGLVGDSKVLELGGDDLRLDSSKGALAEKQAFITSENGGQETLSKVLRAFKTDGLRIDSGPFDVDARETNRLSNANFVVEQIPALRNWVLDTDAADLKILVLKALDYTA